MGWDVKLTAELHLMVRLRMSEAICPVPLYAFMTCIGTTYLYLYLVSWFCIIWIISSFTDSLYVCFNLQIKF